MMLRDSNISRIKPIVPKLAAFQTEHNDKSLISMLESNSYLEKKPHVEEVAPFTLVNQTDLNITIVQGDLD